MKILTWRVVPLLVFVVLAVFLWRGLSLDPHQLPTTTLGQALPNFDLPMLMGPAAKRFTPEIMSEHSAVLVVWASWCAACQEEQLFLDELARQGVRLYGLNYKDDPEAAKRWLKDWGNPYQAIGEDREGRLAIDLGVYGAPETYLIDPDGVIRYRHVGPLSAAVWAREFLPRMVREEKE